jgi:hypothetical protein
MQPEVTLGFVFVWKMIADVNTFVVNCLGFDVGWRLSGWGLSKIILDLCSPAGGLGGSGESSGKLS